MGELLDGKLDVKFGAAKRLRFGMLYVTAIAVWNSDTLTVNQERPENL